jgi:hypothetical protein
MTRWLPIPWLAALCLAALATLALATACHSLYAEDQAALSQEVRLSVLAATHQADGGIGQMLDLSNACAARAIQVRHKLAPTSTTPFDAGCPQ